MSAGAPSYVEEQKRRLAVKHERNEAGCNLSRECVSVLPLLKRDLWILNMYLSINMHVLRLVPWENKQRSLKRPPCDHPSTSCCTASFDSPEAPAWALLGGWKATLTWFLTLVECTSYNKSISIISQLHTVNLHTKLETGLEAARLALLSQPPHRAFWPILQSAKFLILSYC